MLVAAVKDTDLAGDGDDGSELHVGQHPLLLGVRQEGRGGIEEECLEETDVVLGEEDTFAPGEALRARTRAKSKSEGSEGTKDDQPDTRAPQKG
jgi:hypothetical protein